MCALSAGDKVQDKGTAQWFSVQSEQLVSSGPWCLSLDAVRIQCLTVWDTFRSGVCMHARCRGMSSCEVLQCVAFRKQVDKLCVCVCVQAVFISLEQRLSPITSQTAATQTALLMSAGCTRY